MRVLLCRHAHAVDESAHISDEARYLNNKGRRVAQSVGVKLREQGIQPVAVVTSPLVRAVQTAELMVHGMGWNGVIETMHALAPGGSIMAAGQAVVQRGEAVLVVGHEPSISALAGYLSGRLTFPPFRKGQVWLVDNQQAAWWLDPETLKFDRMSHD